jgi:hypothetical protein
MTAWMEGPDMTGTIVKMKAVVEYKSGSRVFTMYDASGKQPAMPMTYTRKKYIDVPRAAATVASAIL